jgi:hypothetical protein
LKRCSPGMGQEHDDCCKRGKNSYTSHYILIKVCVVPYFFGVYIYIYIYTYTLMDWLYASPFQFQNAWANLNHHFWWFNPNFCEFLLGSLTPFWTIPNGHFRMVEPWKEPILGWFSPAFSGAKRREWMGEWDDYELWIESFSNYV